MAAFDQTLGLRVGGFAGAVVSYQPFDAEDISGLLYWAQNAASVIGVNSNDAKVRQRFTIAHELGHLTLLEGQELILERHFRLNYRGTFSVSYLSSTDQSDPIG